MEPATKKPKVDGASLMQSLGAHLQSQKDSIDQHTKALKVSMRTLLHDTMKERWSEFPEELRLNPVCVVEALLSKQGRNSARNARWGPPSTAFIQLSDIPEEMLKSNRGVQLAALKSSLLPWDEVRPTPEECRQSKTFSLRALLKGGLILNLRDDAPLLTQGEVRKLLQNQAIRWDLIPTDLKDDLGFCRSVALIPEKTSSYGDNHKPLAEYILYRHGSFRVDETFWRMLVTEYPHKFDLRSLFEEENFVPASLINDREFIRLACEKDNFILREIPSTNLVLELVRSDPKKLGCVSFDFIRTHQDFVVSQLEAFSRSLSVSDYDYADHLFQNAPMLNEVAISTAWLQAGLPMGEFPPEDWATDSAKFLLLAEHCRYSLWKVTSFRFASEELRNDADFITAAMNFDPHIFDAASEPLQRANFELAVWALSDSDEYANKLKYWRRREVEDHRSRAEQEIAMHDAFVNPFLSAVCDNNDRASVLSRLDEDRVKSLIADFVGIRRGKTLRHIRGALANIARHWETTSHTG